jgi:hypothetical protein
MSFGEREGGRGEREEVDINKKGKLLSVGMHPKTKGQHKIQGREYNPQRVAQYIFW